MGIEVALTLVHRWQRRGGFRAFRLPGALIVSEPEEAVFQDRPTPYSAKLFAVQFGPREPCRIREVAVGIQRAIAQEPKSVAVKTVGARLGDGVHDRAAEFSIFGVEAVGDEAELFDRIEIGDQAGAEKNAADGNDTTCGLSRPCGSRNMS